MTSALPFTRESLHAHYAAGGKPAEIIREAYRRIAAAGDPAFSSR